jgi:hypothetical protein
VVIEVSNGTGVSGSNMKQSNTNRRNFLRNALGPAISGTLANVLAVGVITLCGFLWAQRHWVVRHQTSNAAHTFENPGSGARSPLPNTPAVSATPTSPMTLPLPSVDVPPSTPNVVDAEPQAEFPAETIGPGTRYETILGERFPIPYTAVPNFFSDDPSHRHSARHIIWQGDLMLDRNDLNGAQQEWRNVVHSAPGTPESRVAKQRLRDHP